MSDATYRWHLRQLQREREPSRDLWAGIVAAIAQPKQEQARVVRDSAWRDLGSAVAACVVLGAFGLGLAQPRLLEKAGLHRPTPEHRLVLKEAEAIRKQYQRELHKFDGKPVPASITPALLELDQSAEKILVALDSHPDAVFLLDQLRRTYARRLQITQRVAML